MARRTSSTRSKARRSESDSRWFGWWHGLSAPVQHALCIAALIAVAFTFFSSIIFTPRSLIGGDTVNWRAMAESMLQYEQETGERALWATNLFSGMPGYHIHYPDEVPQADAVARWMRGFMWPASHFIFLLLGTYILAFFLTRQNWASVMAAVGYGLTTYIPVILVAGHNTKFIALCFAPWLVLAFVYALRRGTVLSALLFAAALAINLRADHVQITYYVSFLLGVWWIVEAVTATRAGRLADFGRSTAMLALGSILGLLMVAQPYLAHYEYKQFTIRGAGPGGGEGALDWEYAMNWSQGWSELLTLMVANAFGGGGQTYWGTKPFTAGPHYVGAVALVLAVIALIRYRTPVIIGIAVGTLLMTLFSLGHHFPLLNRPMFEYFPLFDAFRVPETWLSVVALALMLLAAWGARALVAPDDGPEAIRPRIVLGVFGGTAALLLVLVLFQDAFFPFQRPAEVQEVAAQIAQANQISPEDPRVEQAARQFVSEQRTERAVMFRADSVRSLVFLLLAGGFVWMFTRRRIPGWGLHAALTLLILVDLWGVGRRYLNDDALVAARSVEERIPEFAFDRFIKERVDAAGGPGHFRVLSLEGNPTVNVRPSFHYESIGGYHGAKLRLYQDYIDYLLFDERGMPNRRALDLMNTRFVIARGAYPGMEPVFQDEQTGMVVSENPDALPRGFFVDEVEFVEGAESTWARILDDDLNPRRTALVHGDELRGAGAGAGEASAELVTYSPRNIEWDVDTDAPRLFVVNEVYYPAGWKAFVDDEELPIHRVNYLHRAVVVPEGSHRLEMRFDPESHTVGVWIAGLATIAVYGGILLLVVAPYVRRRRDTAVAEASP